MSPVFKKIPQQITDHTKEPAAYTIETLNANKDLLESSHHPTQMHHIESSIAKNTIEQNRDSVSHSKIVYQKKSESLSPMKTSGVATPLLNNSREIETKKFIID